MITANETSANTLQASALRLANSLHAGSVYRREELAKISTSIDRHLKELVKNGFLKKIYQGLYYAPRISNYGVVPPDDKKLVEAFLRDDDFLIFSPSAYNATGVGATQLYNQTWVYNHKRHGVFKLGNRMFDFRVKQRFPKKLTPDFLFIDLLNNVDELVEDRQQVLLSAQRKAALYDHSQLLDAVKEYGSVATKKRVLSWINA